MQKQRLIDLSHTVEDGMVTYRGLPAPLITDYRSREASRQYYTKGTSFHMGQISMLANTGTYVDAPSHRYRGKEDISALSLDAVANLPGVRITIPPGDRAVGKKYFEDLEIGGKAVLVHTGWSAHWRTSQYFEEYPYLTARAANYLVAKRVALVGIDSLNIDDDTDGVRPVHTALLGSGIPIVEHLRDLDALPATGFRFTAAPVKVKGLGSFPVRAFASVDL